MSDPRSVVVVSPNWLGDAVMALPAIADVRRRFPAATLVVAARRSVARLFGLAPAVDEVIDLDWRGGLFRGARLRADAERLRRAAPEVAILLPNSFAAAWLARAAGVRERWGYGTDLRRPLLSRAVRRPRGSVHQGAYYQHLVRQLGIENGPLEPVLQVGAAAIEDARHLLIARGWDGVRPLAVIAPGAAYGTAKRWPPRHVATLSRRLVDERRAHVVYVGSIDERDTVASIVGALPPEAARFAADLTGETTLDALGGVLRLARVCVSNDSGTMHLAAAIGTPVAALFGPTRERETAPLPAAAGRTRVLINPVWCRPCMLRECPIDHRCMTGLRPDDVVAAVDDLMTPVGPVLSDRPNPVGPVLSDRPTR